MAAPIAAPANTSVRVSLCSAGRVASPTVTAAMAKRQATNTNGATACTAWRVTTKLPPHTRVAASNTQGAWRAENPAMGARSGRQT